MIYLRVEDINGFCILKGCGREDFPHSGRYDERAATMTFDEPRYKVGIILSRPKIFSVVEFGCRDVKHPLNPGFSSYAVILASEFLQMPTIGSMHITIKHESKVKSMFEPQINIDVVARSGQKNQHIKQLYIDTDMDTNINKLP